MEIEYDITAEINGSVVSIAILGDIEPKSLVPSFIHNGESLLINGIEQISGETANDYSMPFNFRIVAADGSYREYRFSVEFLKIGDRKGGGIVVFLDQENLYTFDALIAAEQDLNRSLSWGGSGIVFYNPGTGTGIGCGLENTEIIVQQIGGSDFAAQACFEIVLNGYDDWFLPSVDELGEVYKQRAILTGLDTRSHYWSSSSMAEYMAQSISFVSGGTGHLFRDSINPIRPVRYFSY